MAQQGVLFVFAHFYLPCVVLWLMCQIDWFRKKFWLVSIDIDMLAYMLWSLYDLVFNDAFDWQLVGQCLVHIAEQQASGTYNRSNCGLLLHYYCRATVVKGK